MTDKLSSGECQLLTSMLYDGQRNISQEDRKALQTIVDSVKAEKDGYTKMPSQENISHEQSTCTQDSASDTSPAASSTVVADSGCSSDYTVTECGSEWSLWSSSTCCEDLHVSGISTSVLMSQQDQASKQEDEVTQVAAGITDTLMMNR